MKLLLTLLLFVVACESPNPGAVRQKRVYERCLKSEASIGVGPTLNTNGTSGIAVTTSSTCVKSQEVWVTEKYEFNEWVIQKVELRNL